MNLNLDFSAFCPERNEAVIVPDDMGQKRITAFYTRLHKKFRLTELRVTCVCAGYVCVRASLSIPGTERYDFWSAEGFPFPLQQVFGDGYRKRLRRDAMETITRMGGEQAGFLSHWRRTLPFPREGLIGIDSGRTILLCPPGTVFPAADGTFPLPLDMETQRGKAPPLQKRQC